MCLKKKKKEKKSALVLVDNYDKNMLFQSLKRGIRKNFNLK